MHCVPDIVQFKIPENGSHEWIAYTVKTNKELVLQSLLSGKEQRFSNVVDFSFDKKGTVLVFKTSQDRNAIAQETLQWFDLKTSKVSQIWPGTDSSGDRIAWWL